MICLTTILIFFGLMLLILSYPVIIYFDFCENLLFSGKEFQRKGVKEHVRKNCWTSSLKTKAQINEPVKVFIMSENQLLNYYV